MVDQAHDVSQVFIELGVIIVGFALLARFANRLGFSAIPPYFAIRRLRMAREPSGTCAINELQSRLCNSRRASTRSSTTERKARARPACAAAGMRIEKARGRGLKTASPSATAPTESDQQVEGALDPDPLIPCSHAPPGCQRRADLSLGCPSFSVDAAAFSSALPP